jgi:hypothetical protein
MGEEGAKQRPAMAMRAAGAPPSIPEPFGQASHDVPASASGGVTASSGSA